MTVENLELNVKTNITKSTTDKITSLADALGKLEAKASALTGLSNLSELASAMAAMSGVRISASAFTGMATGIGKLTEALQGITPNNINTITSLSTVMQGLSGTSVKASAFSGLAKGIGNLHTSLSLLTQDDLSKLLALGNALSGLSSLNLQGLNNISDITRASNALRQNAKEIDRVGHSAKRATRHTGGLFASLKRIAMYRLLRTIIKEITQAFSEGLKNAYLFSAGIDGSGHRFAEAMDRISSAGTQLKSQLGSALISLIATVEPVLVQLINLAIRAADAVTQLFAAFTGNTYLRAVAVTDTLVDDFQSGAKAAKEWKNQLLGFDVINRLNEPSGGGGGLTPSELFGGEAAPIDEKWKRIAELIKKFIPDMETLKRIAKELLYIFLAWKIGSAFGQGLQQTVGLILMVYSAFRLVDDIIHAINDGFTWDSLKDILLDIAGLAAGAALAFGRIGLGIALVVGGAALIVAAFKDMETEGMNLKNVLGMISGLLIAGLGISVLTGSWIPLAIAGVASLLAYLVYAFGEGQNFTEGMRKIFDGLGKFLKNIFAGDVDEAMNGLKLAWEGAKQVGQSVVNALQKCWESFLDWIGEKLGPRWKELFENAGITVKNWFTNIKTGITGVIDFIKGITTGDWKLAWEGFYNIVSGILGNLATLVYGILNVVNFLVQGVKDLIGSADTLKAGENVFYDYANGTLGNGLGTGGTNDPYDWIKKTPGFASGGWPNTGSLFIAQERGPELVGSIGGKTAVATNDDIVASVSDGVYRAVSSAMGGKNQNVTVHVYLDSREIKAGQSRLARATGV